MAVVTLTSPKLFVTDNRMSGSENKTSLLLRVEVNDTINTFLSRLNQIGKRNTLRTRTPEGDFFFHRISSIFACLHTLVS